MEKLVPIDLTGVVDDVKAEGKGRRVLWQDSESIAFLSSGRKERWDFHIDPADEVTLQLTAYSIWSTVTKPAKNTPLTSKPAKCSSARPECRTRRGLNPTPGSLSLSASAGLAKSITSSGSATSAAKVYETSAKVGDYRADPVGGSPKSSPAMNNCAPAKIAAR